MAEKLIDYDKIGTFFDNNVDPEDRIIYIGAPDIKSEDSHNITFHTSSEVIKSLLLLESISKDEITIILSTYGGDIYASCAIYDALKACESPIKVIGAGCVMSGGSIILQGADHGNRFLYPSTIVMLHDGEDGYAGHARDFEKWSDNSKILRSLMYNIYASNCGLVEYKSHKADFWRKKLDRDWIMTASDAVKWNIADSIIRTLK